MMLRNHNRQNQQLNENIKVEKRHTQGGGGDAIGEPKAKKVALTDTFSNVLIDSSKKLQDVKPRLNGLKALDSIREESAADSKPDLKQLVKPDPCPGYDYDKECGKNIINVSEFAADIFNYYKHRQGQFKITDYLKKQRNLTVDMRALLVNWMVNVQEQFELNHETLYLAVKIVDLYLARTPSQVHRSDLQLVGGTAIFLASKFDERVSPMIDDILYMCDDAYTANQIISMEQILFKTVGFDLGVPISYRFLRRFARVIKLDMQTLTLARYVLETSLMFYQFVGVKDDLMAAAALLLALRMKNLGDWDARLVKYSGYSVEEVEPLMKSLNHMIIKRIADYDRLDIIYNKYSHEVFHEVAKIQLLEDGEHVLADPIGPPKELSFSQTC